MMFLTDTCFWSHARELADARVLDVRLVFRDFRWAITRAVLDELKHHGLADFVEVKNAYIFPVAPGDVASFKERFPAIKELDLADQTLVIAAQREGATVLTDDGGLLLECKFHGITALTLPFLCVSLVERGLMESRVLNRCIRTWENEGRYSRAVLNRLKAWKQRELPLGDGTD